MSYFVGVIRKYAVFSGRARRAEYWWYTLGYLVLAIIASVVDAELGTGSIVSLVLTLALFSPSLGVSIRRLHDTDRSGWWLLVGFIPFIGSIVLLIFMLLDGTKGTNRFGPSPKYGAGIAA